MNKNTSKIIISSCLILITIFCYFFFNQKDKETEVAFPILKYKFEELQSDVPSEEDDDEEEEDQSDELITNNKEPEDNPVIAIILSGPELAEYSSQLPAEINFAITKDGIAKFANDNHFLVMNLPLEKADILSQKNEEVANRQKSLEENSALLNDFIGKSDFELFYGDSDEIFTNEEKNATALFEAIKNKNKIFLSLKSDKTSPLYQFSEKISFKVLANDVILDSTISVEEINSKFSQLESIANSRGYAIASGGASPLTIELLKRWLEDIKDKKIKIISLDKFNIIVEKRAQKITRDVKKDE